MPLVQQYAESGTEHFLPYAKKKIIELHEYMTRSGLGAFNKRVDVSDGSTIYLSSRLLGGQFTDRIRIMGGGHLSFFLALPPKSLAVTITLVSSDFVPSGAPVALVFNGTGSYWTLGVATQTVRLTGPLRSAEITGTYTLSEVSSGGAFGYLKKTYVNYPLPSDVVWNPPTNTISAGIINHEEIGFIAYPTPLLWADTSYWTTVGGGMTERGYSDALIAEMRTPGGFTIPAGWLELLQSFAGGEIRLKSATKVALTFFRPVLVPALTDKGIFSTYTSYDEVLSVNVYGTLMLDIARDESNPSVISFAPTEWFEAATTTLSREDLGLDVLPPVEPSSSQTVLTSWIGARLETVDMSPADEVFRRAILTAAAAPPLLPVRVQRTGA